MKNDCYLHDKATLLNEYYVIEKNDDNFKKTKHTLKAAICKKCGYVEFYVDVKGEDAE
jgi:predicted Zn-ribbon and HTH transcriptional regulator